MSKKDLQLPELIAKVKGGDEGAFEELYERYFRLAYFIAYKICQSDADTKDIVQEAFVEVKRSIHSLQSPDAFKFWLNRIILSKSRNLFRKNKYHGYDEDTYNAKSNLVEGREYMLPAQNSRNYSDKEVLAQLIDTLPDIQRQVLVLFYLEQFSILEVASILEISEGTVKSRLSYARANLRKKVELYERVNDIKLNFHNIGEAISAALIAEMATIQLPKSLVALSLLSKHKGSPLQSFVTTTLGKTALATLCVGTTVVGGAMVVQEMKKQEVVLPSKSQQEIPQSEESFPEINALGKKIVTAKSAYFNIRYFACCEEEMKNLSDQEMQDIGSIFEKLEEVESPYYEALVDEGWLASFEKIRNEHNEK